MTDKDRPNLLPPPTAEHIKRELFGIDGASPPKGGRFKAGQSGNPKGRPKRVAPEPPPGLLAIDEAILREINRTVSVREDGAVKDIGRRQALTTAILKSALNGSAPAQRLALEMVANAEQAEAIEIAWENETFERYCDLQWHLIAEAAHKGEPPPQPLPHPDDVVIVPGKRVRFDGPCSPEDLAKCERTAAMRDVLIMQDVLDERIAGETPRRSALLMATLLNNNLPRRMRLSEAQMLSRRMDADVMSQRMLLKQVYRSWRKLGIDKPRGSLSPLMDPVVKHLHFAADLVSASSKGKINLAAMGRGEFNDAAREIMEKYGAKA